MVFCFELQRATVFRFTRNVKCLVLNLSGVLLNDKKLIQQTYKNTFNRLNIQINEKKFNKVTEISKNQLSQLFTSSNNNVQCFEKNYETEWWDLSSTHEIYNHLIEENKEIILNTNIKKDFTNTLISNKIFTLKNYGLKIACVSNYPQYLHNSLITQLGLNDIIGLNYSYYKDELKAPYPYILYKIMEKFKLKNTNEMITAFDEKDLIMSGQNAKCFKNIGILSDKLSIQEMNIIRPDSIIADISHLEYRT